MRRPIFFKILAGFLGVALTLAIFIFAASYEIIKSHYIRATAQNLQKIIIPLRQVIIPLIEKDDIHALQVTAKQYGHDLDLRVTIIDTKGKVLADSERDPATMENHRDRPEVKQAMTGVIGQSIRFSTTLEQDLMYIAMPVEIHGRTAAVLRLSMTLKHLGDLLNTLFLRLMWLTLAVIVLSIFLSALFSQFLSTPIRALSKAAGNVARGDFTVRVPPRTNDEIMDLTESFNKMAQQLETTFNELSTRKEELEGILFSINECLLVIDAQGRVMLHNQALKKIVTADTIMGRFYWEILRSARLNALMDESHHGISSGEIELAGNIYLCSITPLASKQVKVMVLHDITQMKQLEQIKKDLAANISHELRTPLTAIKGFTETLMDEADSRAQEYLRIIHRHTDRLIAMVNDLLIISEMEEKPRISREDVNIQELVKGVLAIYEPRIRDKGLELIVDCPAVTINADPFRLEQLLTNLVENALKYTEKGSIAISAEIKDYMAVITVKDTGIGIPKEHLGRIFERFYVVDKSRSRVMGGTGLGLSIAKHIVTLHGGSIEAESTPFVGSTFTVFLPVK
ncbi:MAG TPA: ATP-binding protein [Desulfomonilia bacterium]|nr:ATP-binding protein [Desulfomonilia bacterium]